MWRSIHRTVMAQLMDALNVQRKGALLSLPFEPTIAHVTDADSSSSSSSSSSSPSSLSRIFDGPLETEKEAIPFVRNAVLRVAEHTSIGREGNRPYERSDVGTLMEGRRIVGLDLASTSVSCSFNRSDLSGSEFTDTLMNHCTFNLARMRGCDLSGGQFHSCTFLATDAVGVRARRGRFFNCVFCRADMTGWNVCGATFYRCSFTMSELSDWVYDSQTTVVEPVDWGRCRRLNWTVGAGCDAGECRVVGKGDRGERSPSLRPRDHLPSRG